MRIITTFLVDIEEYELDDIINSFAMEEEMPRDYEFETELEHKVRGVEVTYKATKEFRWDEVMDTALSALPITDPLIDYTPEYTYNHQNGSLSVAGEKDEDQ